MFIHRKALIVCTALSTLGLLPGCDKIDDMLGVERTMPDGVTYADGPRHPPILNPNMGSNYDMALSIPPQEGTPHSPTLNIESGNYLSHADAIAENVRNPGRHVPAENAQGQQQFAANDVTVSETSAAPAPTSTEQNAPVAPVTAGTSYPSLTAVPPVPVHTGKEQSADEMKALNTQRDASESARKGLMSDPNATVMTSPQTGQMVDNAANAAPQPPAVLPPASAPTPAPVAAIAPPPSPPPATPNATPSESGFNAWLHNTFSSNGSSVASEPVRHAPIDNAAIAPPAPEAPHDLLAGQQPPASPGAPYSFSQPLPAQTLAASPSPTVEQPPVIPQAASAPETAYAPPPPAIMQPASPPVPPAMPAAPAAVEQVPAYPAVASQPDPQPVHLHPPGTMATDDSGVSPSGDMTSPVALTPPSGATTSDEGTTAQHYLSDSRYAARRMSQVAADTSAY